MIFSIRKFIPENAKAFARSFFQAADVPEWKELKGKKKVIIALGGFYQNLGDMAITYAQKQLITEALPEHQIIFLASADTYKYIRALKRIIEPGDIITINGGGNMDDLYLPLENSRRFIVKSFPKNPVISFPQTISFSDTPRGKRELKKSARIYGAHKNFEIFAREFLSEDSMKRHFPANSVKISPDVVLSLDLENKSLKRNGIMLTLRQDLEALLSASERKAIEQLARRKTTYVSIHDTSDISIEDCQPETYEDSLNRFWSKISTHQIVITDRLHSMIFCAITKTPVIVLSNSNHKIKGTYEAWLQDHNYVKFLPYFDLNEISKAIDNLLNLKHEEIFRPNLSNEFEGLRSSLKSAGM